MKTYIYKIQNTINGKMYIGKTEAPELRWKAHKKSAENGSDLLIHRAIRKYGHDAFVFEVIANVDDDGSILESETIKLFDCCVLDGTDCGYNMTRGGDGFTSEETSYYLNIRTKEGRNPFSASNGGSEIAIAANKKLVQDGRHIFQQDHHRKIVSETQRKLVENGTHVLQGERGSVRSKAVQKKRIEEGSFHMHQPDMKEHQRQMTKRAIDEGRHNSQVEYTCPHCNKTGKGPMMKRWHFESCKHANINN